MKQCQNTNKILTAQDIYAGIEQDKADERINIIARNGGDGEHYKALENDKHKRCRTGVKLPKIN